MSAPAGAPLGKPRVHLRRTDSTNERARALAAAGAPHGTLVTAAEQTAGRGRQGRSWSAPAGSSLLASVLLRSPAPLLPLAAAVAVSDVVGDGAMIKWPNDVVIPDGDTLRKLAGILVESRPQQGWAVLGIGVNVAVEISSLPEELRATAATMGRRAKDLEPLLDALLEALSSRLAERADSLLTAWSARDALRGRRLSWGPPSAAPGDSGVACGIDGEGRLIVTLDSGGQTTLTAGEVHLRSPD